MKRVSPLLAIVLFSSIIGISGCGVLLPQEQGTIYGAVEGRISGTEIYVGEDAGAAIQYWNQGHWANGAPFQGMADRQVTIRNGQYRVQVEAGEVPVFAVNASTRSYHLENLDVDPGEEVRHDIRIQ